MLSSIEQIIEQLNSLWQLQQWFVPSLTMDSMPPSRGGTPAWQRLKARQDSLGQFAYDPQAVAAPKLVRSKVKRCQCPDVD